MTKALYNETFQTRDHEPTAYENLLGDAIERAYSEGIHELEGLVAYLNRVGPLGPNGALWTDASYKAEMARLGA